jgi:hypothetical protein
MQVTEIELSLAGFIHNSLGAGRGVGECQGVEGVFPRPGLQCIRGFSSHDPKRHGREPSTNTLVRLCRVRVRSSFAPGVVFLLRALHTSLGALDLEDSTRARQRTRSE